MEEEKNNRKMKVFERFSTKSLLGLVLLVLSVVGVGSLITSLLLSKKTAELSLKVIDSIQRNESANSILAKEIKLEIARLDSTIRQLENSSMEEIKKSEEKLMGRIGNVDEALLDQVDAKEQIIHFLNEAQHLLAVKRNKHYALVLVRRAYKVSKDINEREFLVLTKILSAQLLKIEALNLDEFKKIFSKLKELRDLIADLKLKNLELYEKVEPSEITDSIRDEIWRGLSTIVDFRIDEEHLGREKISNSIDQSYFKILLTMHTQEMRLAVLNQDQDLYEETSDRLSKSLDSIRLLKGQRQSITGLLAELTNYQVSPASTGLEQVILSLRRASQ